MENSMLIMTMFNVGELNMVASVVSRRAPASCMPFATGAAQLTQDHLTSLKRRLLKNRLNSISKGAIQVDYPMKFPNKTKR